MNRSHLFVAGAVAVTLVAAACTSESDTRVAVIGTDDACTPDVDEVGAGTVTFEFTNEAGQVSELYVLRADGSVASEVENVTTGTTRNLTVDLSAGNYRLTCKPGQAGEGFSHELTVTGGGVEAAAAEGVPVEVGGTEYAFDLRAGTPLSAGTTYTFELVNEGTIQHEMEVFAPNGEAIGEVGPTDAGASGRVTLRLEEPGTYRLVCGIDGHEAKGMALDLLVE